MKFIKSMIAATLVISSFSHAANWVHEYSNDAKVNKWALMDGDTQFNIVCNKTSMVLAYVSSDTTGLIPYVDGYEPFGLVLTDSKGVTNEWSPIDMDFWKKNRETQQRFNKFAAQLKSAIDIKIVFNLKKVKEFSVEKNTLPSDMMKHCKIGAPVGFVQ